jgi:hypothetical protein
VTGSIFTKFSLETNSYKEKTAALLLKAFVAADKVNNLGAIRQLA